MEVPYYLFTIRATHKPLGIYCFTFAVPHLFHIQRSLVSKQVGNSLAICPMDSPKEMERLIIDEATATARAVELQSEIS